MLNGACPAAADEDTGSGAIETGGAIGIDGNVPLAADWSVPLAPAAASFFTSVPHSGQIDVFSVICVPHNGHWATALIPFACCLLDPTAGQYFRFMPLKRWYRSYC